MQKLAQERACHLRTCESACLRECCDPEAVDANGVLTNPAKNGDTSRHDGAAERPGKLGTIGLQATRQYERDSGERTSSSKPLAAFLVDAIRHLHPGVPARFVDRDGGRRERRVRKRAHRHRDHVGL
jgi:hypothetical protein